MMADRDEAKPVLLHFVNPIGVRRGGRPAGRGCTVCRALWALLDEAELCAVVIFVAIHEAFAINRHAALPIAAVAQFAWQRPRKHHETNPRQC